MGIFFEDPKPRVTLEKFKRYVRNSLASNGLTNKEIDFVEGFFNGNFYDPIERRRGVDEVELARGIEWLRTHENNHTLSPNQIDILEREMTEWMKRSH